MPCVSLTKLAAPAIIVLAAALVLSLTLYHESAGTEAANLGAKSQMDLVVNGGLCDSGIAAKCTLALGGSFTLSVVPSILPDDVIMGSTGYGGWQTFIDYGSLLYKPAAGPEDEISWDRSFLPLRLPAEPAGKEGKVTHADISELFPPLPVSHQKTALLALDFNCARNGSSESFSQAVTLIPYDEVLLTGALFFGRDGLVTADLAPNTGSLEINCVPKQADPGDSDQDGCSDQAENGPDEAFGGQRNAFYFWDFYDVWTHPAGDPVGWERNKVINVFDILGVALRFGPGPELSKIEAFLFALAPPAGESGYHAGYDRGPVVGPNPWDRGPPDASINIVDDILGVAAQFGHNCA